MIVKVHSTPDGRNILAVCDKSLIGKKFEEKKLQLDLTSEFYNGNENNEEEIKSLFKKSHIINLVGKKSVELGIKEGIISEKSVIYIKKIPIAHCLFL
jgi:hypothetical protein